MVSRCGTCAFDATVQPIRLSCLKKPKMNNKLVLLLAFVILAAFRCEKEPNRLQGCYKGRLEVKGICMNYTIKVVQGAIDPNLLQASWTDPSTGKTYENVFALSSVCDFPADIEEGEEFYFQVNTRPNMTCAVCEAYYPTPQKSLSISVSDTPCPQD